MEQHIHIGLLLLFLQPGGALELNVPSSYRVAVGSETWIPCSFTVDKPPVDPKYFVVFWSFKGYEILTYDDFVKTQDRRYSLNTENSLNGNASLSISRVQLSDEGVYTCSILYSSERKEKEVALFVHAPPQINITRRIAFIDHTSILRAAVTGFYPENIDIKWLRDGEMLNNYTVSRPQRNPDDTYSVNSTVTIKPTEEDKHRTFSCRVQHESLSAFLHKDFQLEFAAAPEISVTGRNVILNQENVLSCSITGLYLEDIDVKWLKDGNILDQVSVSRPQRNQDGTYSVNSTVTIKPIEEDKDRTFSCWVQHESLSEPQYKDFQLEFAGEVRSWHATIISFSILIIVYAVILWYLMRKKKKPGLKVEDISIPTHIKCGKLTTLQCEISNFYPDNLTVTWNKLQRGSLFFVRVVSNKRYWISDLKYEKQQDNTYSCSASLLFIPSLESDQGAEFLCRVEHPSLKRPIERRTEPLQVMVFPQHVGNIIIQGQLQCNKSVTLQCEISKFYPDKLTVTWLKNQKESNDDIPVQTNEHYQIPDLTYVKQWRNNTYSCTASLVFTPSYESDEGAEFLCRVEHPNLERPIERRTKPLQVKETR